MESEKNIFIKDSNNILNELRPKEVLLKIEKEKIHQLFIEEISLLKDKISQTIFNKFENVGSTSFDEIIGSNILDILITTKEFPLPFEIIEEFKKNNYKLINENFIPNQVSLFYKEINLDNKKSIRGIKIFVVSEENEEMQKNFLGWRETINSDKLIREKYFKRKYVLIRYY